MQRFYATYSFDELSPLEKAEFAEKHATKITGSSLFGTLPYSALQITTAAGLLRTKHGAWNLNHGDDEHKAFLLADIDMSLKLRKNADEVSTIADGDKDVVESAGFVASKERASKSTEHYFAENAKETGEVKLHCKKEVDDVAIVWLYFKGKQPPATMDEYKYFGCTSSSTIQMTVNEVGVYYCFIAGRVKHKNEGVAEFLAPIVNIGVL